MSGDDRPGRTGLVPRRHRHSAAGPGASVAHACIAASHVAGSTPGGGAAGPGAGPTAGPGGSVTPCSFRQCAYAPCSTVGGVVVVSGEDGEPQPTAAATMAADSTEYAKSRATVSRRTATAGPTDVEPGRRRRRRVPRRRPDRRRRRCRRAVWRRRPARRTCCAPAHR